MRGALRLAAGTATLAGGGLLLRALQGAPAALGADPAAIHAAAAGSPNYQDGVFVNLEPASAASVAWGSATPLRCKAPATATA